MKHRQKHSTNETNGGHIIALNLYRQGTPAFYLDFYASLA